MGVEKAMMNGIKKRLVDLDISTKELANDLGIRYQSLLGYLAGRKSMKLDTYIIIDEYLEKLENNKTKLLQQPLLTQDLIIKGSSHESEITFSTHTGFNDEIEVGIFIENTQGSSMSYLDKNSIEIALSYLERVLKRIKLKKPL